MIIHGKHEQISDMQEIPVRLHAVATTATALSYVGSIKWEVGNSEVVEIVPCPNDGLAAVVRAKCAGATEISAIATLQVDGVEKEVRVAASVTVFRGLGSPNEDDGYTITLEWSVPRPLTEVPVTGPDDTPSVAVMPMEVAVETPPATK